MASISTAISGRLRTSPAAGCAPREIRSRAARRKSCSTSSLSGSSNCPLIESAMLILSEDQKLLMTSARGAVAEKAPIAEFRKLRADPNGLGFSPAFWRASAELGWTGVLVPETFGGLDFGVVGAGLIAREMARELAISPFLSTSVLSASALARAGSATQKAEWLPQIARGEAVVALALDEGARPGAIAAKATRTASGFRLDGVKHLVLDGQAADAMLIAVECEGQAALLLAKADATGLS